MVRGGKPEKKEKGSRMKMERVGGGGDVKDVVVAMCCYVVIQLMGSESVQ